MAKTWIICIDGTWNQPGQETEDPVTAQEDAAPSECRAHLGSAREYAFGDGFLLRLDRSD